MAAKFSRVNLERCFLRTVNPMGTFPLICTVLLSTKRKWLLNSGRSNGTLRRTMVRKSAHVTLVRWIANDFAFCDHDLMLSYKPEFIAAPVPAKPFQIITGQGKHSINHVGILGPGVANELERAGWYVDRGYNGRGYIVVRGVKG
jgi:hypothetical protein